MLIDFRTLFPKYNITPRGVLHIGANRGEEASIYLELGITKQVWYEANPEMYELLLKTIENNHDATAYNLCVGDEFKESVLHIANNAGQSSSVLPLGTHAVVHKDVFYTKDISVQMVRLDVLPMDEDLDFLNIDIQGAELMALKGMGELLHQFKWAYLEVNKAHLYENCPLIEELDEYLLKYGFERVETYWAGNTNWGDALYINNQFTDKNVLPIKMPWIKK